MFRYEVRGEPDHTSSIAATFTKYKVHWDVRLIPLRLFSYGFADNFYSDSDWKRVHRLKTLIEESRWVSPLIAVRDKEGYYILEGAHRLVALGMLGAKSLPAIIVEDLEP